MIRAMLRCGGGKLGMEGRKEKVIINVANGQKAYLMSVL